MTLCQRRESHAANRCECVSVVVNGGILWELKLAVGSLLEPWWFLPVTREWGHWWFPAMASCGAREKSKKKYLYSKKGNEPDERESLSLLYRLVGSRCWNHIRTPTQHWCDHLSKPFYLRILTWPCKWLCVGVMATWVPLYNHIYSSIEITLLARLKKKSIRMQII